ncbi:MAG: SDR family oxidoreductase, partial [Pseudomonadota bacterium]
GLTGKTEAFGGNALACPGDISTTEGRTAVANRISAVWDGPVTVLVNNAVTRTGRGWEAPLSEWRDAVDVNLWGPLELIRLFEPGMIASGIPSMVLNVGSKQGITNPPGHPAYNMVKAALKSLTEGLEHRYRSLDAPISAHLLVPGWTSDDPDKWEKGAWSSEQVAEFAVQRLSGGAFYIVCPDGETSEAMDAQRIAWGAGDITENRPALSRWHPDWKDAFAKDAADST